ncbi:hypothetical protein Acy02nite_27810 [Actinoplanes cyaneus]|uniref:Uncharacterized protein n=1 Tax=Actinoplanes cyaneus TaxID=52696 RepID=A0A919IMT5_9ACTN|nr:hypothetical protein Acy02nite_27810 [Actinoplanes cyaneus]
MAGHSVPPGRPPMPYDLHVWLYDDNPVGELASENPRVTCHRGPAAPRDESPYLSSGSRG